MLCGPLQTADNQSAHAQNDRVDRRKLGEELVAAAKTFVAVLGRLHEREASPSGTCEQFMGVTYHARSGAILLQQTPTST